MMAAKQYWPLVAMEMANGSCDIRDGLVLSTARKFRDRDTVTEPTFFLGRRRESASHRRTYNDVNKTILEGGVLKLNIDDGR